jgi:periplasmic protein TonB
VLARREWFAETIGCGGAGSARARWLCAPMGAAIHGLAICSVALLALWSKTEPMARPRLPALVLHLAPPPPPAPMRGSPSGADVALVEIATVVGSVAPETPESRAPSIPEEMLSARFDLPRGDENGFDDGESDGMPGGASGGVLGGVPGGLVGGELGGTGTELPHFPKPDVGPSPIRMPQPSYTRDAIRNNVEGSVVLRVVIDEQGKVEVLKVLRSVPGLDEEAIRMVESRWRFQPATKNGRPVSTLSDLIVRFNLY